MLELLQGGRICLRLKPKCFGRIQTAFFIAIRFQQKV
jgi:hypothetical protein